MCGVRWNTVTTIISARCLNDLHGVGMSFIANVVGGRFGSFSDLGADGFRQVLTRRSECMFRYDGTVPHVRSEGCCLISNRLGRPLVRFMSSRPAIHCSLMHSNAPSRSAISHPRWTAVRGCIHCATVPRMIDAGVRFVSDESKLSDQATRTRDKKVLRALPGETVYDGWDVMVNEVGRCSVMLAS